MILSLNTIQKHEMDTIRKHEKKTIKNHDPMCVFWHKNHNDVSYLLEEDRESFFSVQVPHWHEKGIKLRKIEEATDGHLFNSETPTDRNGRYGLIVAGDDTRQPCPLGVTKNILISGATYWWKNKQDRDDCVKMSQKYSKYCAVCGDASKTRCARCGSVRYCGRDCQRIHWKHHKKECVSRE